MRIAASHLVLLVALAGAGLLLSPSIARADDAAHAEELFKAGRAALDKGDFHEACAQFAASLKLNPRPNVTFNLAGCEEHEGRLTDARRHWQEGLHAIEATDERASVAKERIADLDRKIPSLTLRLQASVPAAATVTVDGAAANTSVALPVNPGEHVIVVTAPGYGESRTTVLVVAGEHKEVTLLPPPPSSSSTAPPPPPPPPAPEDDAGRRTRRTAGLVLTGVGVVGVLAAGITGGILLARNGTIHTDCPAKQCNSAGLDEISGSNHLIVGNYVTWGLAVAGLGAGIPLLVTSREHAQVTVGLAASPSATGLRLSGSFRF
jgi:hypothetical protein